MNYQPLYMPPVTKAIKSGKVTLLPGEDVGEHVTDKREEIIVVIDGRASLAIDGKEVKISRGSAYFVGEGKTHNVFNRTKRPLEYIYITSIVC